MSYIPSVVQAIPGPDFTVYAYFSDGSVRLVDVKPYLSRGGVFEPLKDADFFTDRLTVMNYSVAWDVTGDRDATKCIDLDPITIYENSRPVEDPLSSVA